MVVIRLSRGGAKKRPFYHLVATDSRQRRDSGYIERLGYYNPVARGQETVLDINLERVEHWLGQGAQASDRVASLLKKFKKTGTFTGTELAAEKAVIRDKKAKAKAAAAPVAEAEEAAEEATAEATEEAPEQTEE